MTARGICEDAGLRNVLADLAAGPNLYLKEIHPAQDRATFVDMDAVGFRKSAFLDRRIERKGSMVYDIPIQVLLRLQGNLEDLRKPIIFIFHIGHCGSTLVSRLLGALPGNLALREPEPLRTLALFRRVLDIAPGTEKGAHWWALFSVVMSLLSRTHRPDERALVKPSSFCNNLLGEMMAWHPDGRAIFLYVDLDTYLCTMLKANNRKETNFVFEKYHTTDLARSLNDQNLNTNNFSNGKINALIWSINMIEYLDSQEDSKLKDRLIPIQFEEFLQEQPVHLERISRHFGISVEPELIRQTAHDDTIVNRYSKHQVEVFNATSRAKELDASIRENRDEITDAQIWIRDYAKTNERLAPLRELL